MHSIISTVGSTGPSTSSCLVLAGSLALLLAACPDDDTIADTETTADTDVTTGTAGFGKPGSDGGHGSGLEEPPFPNDTSSSTTAVTDKTGDTATTGEPPAQGHCVGYRNAGTIGLVLSRGATPVDTACDAEPAPCGGDPVGSWELEAMCGFEDVPNPLEGSCPGSTFSVEILSQSGTLAFAADGTLVQDFDIVSEIVLTVDPMACFGSSCAALEGVFEDSAPEGSPPPTCEAMDTLCTCTFPDDGLPEQGMASWESMGTDLLIMVEDVTTVFPFCVTEDRLDLWQPYYDMPTPTGAACNTQQDCIDALGDTYDLYTCSSIDD